MQAITTKYHAQTDRRQSRYSAENYDGVKVYFKTDHALNSEENHIEACKKLCKKLNWHGTLVIGGNKTGYVFVFMQGDKFTV